MDALAKIAELEGKLQESEKRCERLEAQVTLDQARQQMFAQSATGVDCPCCGRLVKLYKRRFHAEMAAFLTKLVAAWRTVPRYYAPREFDRSTAKASTDASYLVHWGLIEKYGCSYQPTPAGCAFVANPRTRLVRSHVELLCGEFKGFAGDLVSLEDCLDNKFDYAELMRG